MAREAGTMNRVSQHGQESCSVSSLELAAIRATVRRSVTKHLGQGKGELGASMPIATSKMPARFKSTSRAFTMRKSFTWGDKTVSSLGKAPVCAALVYPHLESYWGRPASKAPLALTRRLLVPAADGSARRDRSVAAADRSRS